MKKLDELLKRAPGGVVGISPDLVVTSGYDDRIAEALVVRPDWMALEDFKIGEMPMREKLALADLMLDRWKRYRESAINAHALEKLNQTTGGVPGGEKGPSRGWSVTA